MSSVKALPVGHVSGPMYVVTDRTQHESSAQYKRPPYPQLPGGSSSHASSPPLTGPPGRGYPYPTSEPAVSTRSTPNSTQSSYPTSVAVANTNSSPLMPPHHHAAGGGTNSVYAAAANHMYRDAHFQVDSRAHQPPPSQQPTHQQQAEIHSLERYAEQQQRHQQHQQQQHARRRLTLKPTPEYPANVERERAALERERYMEAVRYQEAVVGAPFTNAVVPRGIKPLVVSVHTPSEMDMGQPGKRPRLAVEPKAPVHQPLVIDTRNVVIKKEQAYTPQVEAISPTLPSEEGRCDSPMRILKENILGNINRLDKEINQVESQVSKLQKKLHELEAEASKPSVSKEAVKDNSHVESKQMSIAQIIYSENRAKALESHAVLEKLGPKVEIPMYNQPSDTAVYHENKRKFMTFKSRLTNFFKKRHKERELRETHLTETYSKLMQEWIKRVEKRENNAAKKAKDAKLREFFEKQFPELKKQREDKERISRVSQRIRSDAEWEEIIDGLQEQELEEKKMRSYAVIPPIRLDSRQRKMWYVNRNGLVEDMMQEYKEKQMLNIWTDQEKEIFREKYLQHPKNFSLIASFLERKTVADCVQYYYLTKKSENYKQLLRKHNVRKRTRALVKPQAQQHVQGSGITTRQQEDAKSSAVNLSTSATTSIVSSTEVVISTVTATDASNVILSTSSSLSVVTSETVSAGMAQTVSSAGSAATPPVSSASESNTATSKADSKVSDTGTEKEKIHLPNNIRKKKEASKKAEAAEKGAGSDSDTASDHRNQNGPVQPCAICKLEIDNVNQSRPLTKSNCGMFGIKDSDLVGEMRVCASCRFKSVRRRCPIPTCKTPKRKVKRLRPLPGKLSELSKEMKDNIMTEFQIPPDVSKCCSACFNRIIRKLESSSTVSESEPTESSRWTEEEMETFKHSLKQFGTDWDAIAGAVSTKNKEQCRNFYFNYKRKLGLEDLLKEQKVESGKESEKQDEKPPPIVTDEEESGETTSSCEEDNCADRCSSDTASAPSPAEKILEDDKTESQQMPGFLSSVTSPSLAVNSEERKNQPLSQLDASPKCHADYDSSATVSADEGQNQNDGEGQEPSPRIAPNVSQNGAKTSASNDTSRKTFNPPVLKDMSNRPAETGVPLVKTLLQDPNIGSGHSEVTRPSYLDQPQPPAKGKEEPTCVRDLIYQAIEMSLQWPAKPGRNSSPVPVTTSKDSPEVVHVEPKKEFSEASSVPIPPTAHCGSRRPSRPSSHAEMSVVDCEVQDLSKKSRPKDGSPPREYIKRERIAAPARPPSESSGTAAHGHYYGAPPPAHSNQYRSSQPPPALSPHYVAESHLDPYYPRSGEPRGKVYPLTERPHSQPPHLVAQASAAMSPTPPLPKTVGAKSAVPPPPPLIASKPTQLSPKLPYKERLVSVPPSGSITQGTPVNQQPMSGGPNLPSAKYEGFLRQLPPPQTKDGGSITLGTPVQHEPSRRIPGGREVVGHITPAVYDPGVVEYFRHVAPAGQPYMFPPSIPGYPAGAVPARPPYANESQLSSKQIMIDFNTSKQMQLRRGITGDKEVKVSPRGSESSPAPPETHLHPMYPPVNYQGGSAPPYVNQLPATFQPGGDSRFTLLRAPITQIDRTHSPSGTDSPVAFPHPGKRSPGLAQGRQNVIHRSITWGTGKPSVIQAPQSSSPRTGEESSSPAMTRKSTPSPRHPQPLIYQPVPPSGHDAFNTLVNAAAAQPSLVVPKDGKGSPSSRQETKSPRDRPVVEGLEKTLIDMHQRPRSYTDSNHRSSRAEHGRSSGEHPPSETQQHLLGISPDGQRFVAAGPHPAYEMSRESPRHLDRQQGMPSEHSSNIRLGSIREPFSREQFERQMRQPENAIPRERNFPDKEHERPKPPVTENSSSQNYSGHVSDLDNEASKIFSQSFQKDVPRSGSSPRGFTAANLIDAIITRQINQNAENTSVSKSSSVDLFNQYHVSYEGQKGQQRPGNAKGSSGGTRTEVVTIDDEPENEKSTPNWNERPRSHGRSPPVPATAAPATLPVVPVPYAADKVVTLGEHIAAIISKDYNNPSDGHQPQSYFSSSQIPGSANVSASRSSSFPSHPASSSSGGGSSKQLEGIAAALPAEGMLVNAGASREGPDHSPQNCPGSGCVYHTHSWKLRRALQQDKEREHRSPVSVDGPHSRPMSAQAAGSPINQDERQIIRVSQTSSPSVLPPVRSSPVTPYVVEPISPPSQPSESPPDSTNKNRSKSSGACVPVTTVAADAPHGQPASWTPSPGITGLLATRHLYGQEYPDVPPPPTHFSGVAGPPPPPPPGGGLSNRPPHQQQQMGLSPLDYVKNKIVEVMRTATDENPEGAEPRRTLHGEEREPTPHPYKLQPSADRDASSERPCSAGSGMPQLPSQQRYSPAVSRYSPVPPRPSSAAERVPSRNSTPVEQLQRHSKRSLDSHPVPSEWHDNSSGSRTNSRSLSPVSIDPKDILPRKKMRSDSTFMPESNVDHAPVLLPEGAANVHRTFSHGEAPRLSMSGHGVQPSDSNSSKNAVPGNMVTSYPEAFQQSSGQPSCEGQDFRNSSESRADPQWGMSSAHDRGEGRLHTPSSKGVETISPPSRENMTKHTDTPRSDVNSTVASSNMAAPEPSRSSPSTPQGQRNTLPSSSHSVGASVVANSGHYTSFSAVTSGGVSGSTSTAFSSATSLQPPPTANQHLAYSSFSGMSATYAYPYSALTMRSLAGSAAHGSAPPPPPATTSSSSVSSSHVPSVPVSSSARNSPSPLSRNNQPPPLLSSQYEPLSDED